MKKQCVVSQKIKKRLNAILDPKFHELYYEDADHWFTIGHENAHSLGPKDGDAGLGKYRNIIEENKADMVSLSMLDFIEELSKKDFDVYLDRFHISEIVYGRLFRNYDNDEMSNIIDDKLSKIKNLKLIFITSDYYHLDKIKEKEKLNEYLSIQNMFRKEIMKSKIKDKEIINNNY